MIFDDEIAVARSALRGGWSVRVIGDRGGGRSRLAREAAESLRKTGETVLGCTGEPSAQDSEGYVLGRLASELGAAQRFRDLTTRLDLVIDEVARAIEPGTILVLDDPHRMDPVTVRALATLRERLGLRVLVTEIRGIDRNGRFPYRWPERVIDLQPLDLARTSALAAKALGGQLEPSAVTRAFSKTGGSPKLLTALIQSAQLRGLLEQHSGLWRQTGPSLWNDDMVPVVDDQLSEVGEEVGAMLRVLAERGPRGEARLAEEHGVRAVERAKALGVVRQTGASGAAALIAWPPILGDRFRKAGEPVRIGRSSPKGAPDWCGDPGKLTILARRFVERALHDAEEARTSWEQEPSVERALAYYSVASGDPSQQQEVHRVLTTTPEHAEGGRRTDFFFAFARASWVAMQEHEPDRAEDMLRRFGSRFPAWRESAESVVMLLDLMNGRGVPSDLDGFLAPQEDPAGIRESSALMALLASGRIAEARDLSSRIGPGARRSTQWGRQLLPLFEGDAITTLRNASAGMEEAEGTLDRTLFASSAYIAMLAQNYLGEHQAAKQCVDAAVLVGRPQLEYTSIYTACLNIQGLISVLMGQAGATASFFSESAMLLPQPGGFLGMGADSFRAFTDFPLSGTARDRAVVDAVRRRMDLGYLGAAAHTAAASLALSYGPETSAVLQDLQRIRPIPAFAPAAGLAMRIDGGAGPGRIAEYLDELGSGQHDGMLRSVLRSASRFRRRAGDEAEADDLERLAEGSFGPRYLPSTDLQKPADPAPDAVLTPREREVALLAGSLTNRSIAERLTLSVRTVENHLSSAMRKTGVRTRDELFARIEARL